MKCQILFSRKYKEKNITSLLSTELAQRLVKVKTGLVVIKCHD